MQKTADYKASLLGSIASNLAGLQGYDVMALELIQNADDARATSIIFDITDNALIVENNGTFSYCGDLSASPCSNMHTTDQNACDFHRITEVASGGKARQSANIGRFGIGFVSTYQVCDHPQIYSAGIGATLFPEDGKTAFKDSQVREGTQFVLPWATDPNSTVRKQLRSSHINKEDFGRIETDIAKILDGTLLFLQHLKHAELRRNSQLIRSCHLTRDDENVLILEFGPKKREEMWLVLSTDASEPAAALARKFPQLKDDDRRTRVTTGFRLDSEPLKHGLFYAFLPTEQTSGLPLHINADFYPEPDRKSIILSGEKHQQRWNEMLLEVAAKDIAAQLFEQRNRLTAPLVWELLQKAFTMNQEHSKAWQTYFWKALDSQIDADTALAWSDKGEWTTIGQTILPPSDLSTEEARLINRLNLELAEDDIVKRASAVLQNLGTTRLTQKRLADVLSTKNHLQPEDAQVPVDEQIVKNLYQPLWALIDRVSSNPGATKSATNYFNTLPILLTADRRPVSPSNANTCQTHISKAFQDVLPETNMAHPGIEKYSSIRELVPHITLSKVADHLENIIESAEDALSRFGHDGRKIHKLYRALADLQEVNVNASVVQRLRELPIYLTGDGYRMADNVCLAGNFSDPIGFADLLSGSSLDPIIESFFLNTLKMERLELHSYISEVLPRFFAGDIDAVVVNQLLVELATHTEAFDDEGLRTTLASLNLVPTQSGKWAKPKQCYFKTEKLVKILGNNSSYWIDEKQLDSAPSIRNLLRALGLREKPSAQHLAERILHIAKNDPTEKFQSACEKSFYQACALAENEWMENPNELDTFVSTLSKERCLPATGDSEYWYEPEDLYAPYRQEAFSSQALILPFRSTKQLSNHLLQKLGVKNEPETHLVIAHLKQCVDSGDKPAKTVYMILNERCTKDEERENIASLSSTQCIYDESRDRFLRPNQLFWTDAGLGNRALKIPISLHEYRRLFDLLGVKDAPTPLDYLGIALDIINDLGDTGFPISKQDRLIYQKCLEIIANSIDSDEELGLEAKALRDKACILNLEGKLCFPDEIAIRDSDWHESYFGDELSGMLTAFQPELQSLYRLIGIRYLSQKIRPIIGQKHGDQVRTDIAARFHERTGCIIRVLHDRPRTTLLDLSEWLATLKVILCDTLDIMFVCDLRSPPLESPETPEKAHYEAHENTLYISTEDIGEFAIPAFNSLLHILATSPTGASIPNLVLVCELVLDATDLQAAEQKLSVAGFPNEVSLEQSDEDELEGGELGELGTGEEDEGIGIATGDGATQPHEGAQITTGAETGVDHKDRDSAGGQSDQKQTNGSGIPGTESRAFDKAANKQQKERGQKRRDRLLSYVIPKGEEDSAHETDPSILEHNLTVEDRGRAAVVLYEKERGRDAIPQSQDNPGWDIVSTDTATGAIRYIEVKAIDGEWNNVGVGLSKLQFSEALNYHNEYWLYVVENSGDKAHERVYPIQSPATKITSFMFDQNWRGIAQDITASTNANEVEAPADGYVPGVHIDCGLFGNGIIKEVQMRGRTKQLLIDFGNDQEREMNLNTSRMKIIDNPDI